MDENNDQVDIPEIADLPQVEEGQEDTTDWKAKALEAQETAKRLQGMAKRFKTRVDKLTAPKAETKVETKPEAGQNKGFDYAEKAYLKSSGIEATDFDFVKEVMESTGKPLDAVLESKYFQAELKERKELRMTDAATPSGTKRAGNTTRDQVEYWLAKGELPPADQRELRIKVVNAKIAAEKGKSQFTDNPVVGK